MRMFRLYLKGKVRVHLLRIILFGKGLVTMVEKRIRMSE